MTHLLHPLLRKFCCRVLSKGIGKVYQQTFSSVCPARIQHVRSLHCLCKVLPVRIFEKRLTAALLCRSFVTTLSLDSFLKDAENSTLETDTIASRVDLQKFIDFRVSATAVLPATLRQICSWNLNSLQAPSSTQGYKCAVLSRYLRRGPVCIQETKWNDSDIVDFGTRWPGVLVTATPAEGTKANAKGGVAILLPPGFALLEQITLVSASAVAAKVEIGQSQVWLISWHFRPDASRADFEYFMSQLCLVKDAPIFLCGDINRADVRFTDLWDKLLETHNLHDVAPSLPTYHYSGGSSALDRFLIQDLVITDNQFDCQVYTRNYFVDQGHSAISLHISHRPKLQRDPRSVKHEVMPTQAFLLPQSANAEHQQCHHSKNLLYLHRLLARQCIDPLSLVNSQYQEESCYEGRTLVLSDNVTMVAPPRTSQVGGGEEGTLVPPLATPSITGPRSPGQLSFKATLWSWWKTVRAQTPGTQPFKSLYSKLRGQQSVVRVSPKLMVSLQSASGLEELTSHCFPRHNGCHLVPTKLVQQALQQVEFLKCASASHSEPRPAPSPV